MDIGTVLIFLGILTLSGIFSGTETALTAISNVTLTRMADGGSGAAKLLLRMLRDKGRVIAALLVANNIVNVILAVYATVVFDGFLKDKDLLPPWAAPIVASICSVAFLLVFGEVLPKSIAVRMRNQWALASAWFVVGLMFVTRPITWLLIKFSNAIMHMMGSREGDEDIFDVHEINTLAHMGEQAGVIDTLEKQLIQRAAQLNDTRVREIMAPRTDIQGIELASPVEDIRTLFKKTPYSRLPVYKGDLDDIVGVLNFKEFLRHDSSEGFDLRSFLHKPLFVPDSMFIGDLLSEMRAKRSHVAIVLDEYGGTAGLISLEDVVEMLVGRIEDEYDIVANSFEQIDERTWEVDGRVSDERLVAKLGVTLPEHALDGFDTAAGLALKAFGNIPSEGDAATYHGMEITATRVRGHRVRRMRIRVLTADEVVAAELEESGSSGRRRNTRQVKQPNETAGPRKSLDQPQLVSGEDQKASDKQ